MAPAHQSPKEGLQNPSRNRCTTGQQRQYLLNETLPASDDPLFPRPPPDRLVVQFFTDRQATFESAAQIVIGLQRLDSSHGQAAPCREELVAVLSPAHGQSYFSVDDEAALRTIAQQATLQGCEEHAVAEMLSYASAHDLRVEVSFPTIQGQNAPHYFALAAIPAPPAAPQKSRSPGWPQVLTPFPTAAVLSSQSGHALITQNVRLGNQLADRRLVIFLDFNNMGAADAAAREEVNSFIALLRHHWQDVCEQYNLRGLPIRLGGDEFAFIMPDHDRSLGAFQAFLRTLDIQRALLFSPEARYAHSLDGKRMELLRDTSPKLAKAEEYAWLRQQLRSLRRNFMHQMPASESFSLENYRDYLLKQASRLNLPLHGNCAELAMAIIMARPRSGPARQAIMTVTVAPPVRAVSDPGDWYKELLNLRRALATAKELIHESKELGSQGLPDPVDCSADIKIRAAELATMQAGLAVESQVRLAQERLLSCDSGPLALKYLLTLEQQRIRGSDPAINDGTLRYDLVRMHTLVRLVPALNDQQGYILICDIEHFGVLNNQLGYERADELMSLTARKVRKHLQGALLVRANGGSLVAITTTTVCGRALVQLRRDADLALRLMSDDATKAEIEERQLLGRWKRANGLAEYAKETGIQHDRPRLRIHGYKLRLDPHATLHALLQGLV